MRYGVLLFLVGCAGAPAEPEEPLAGPVPVRMYAPDLATLGALCTAHAIALCRSPSTMCEPTSTMPYRDATECVELTRTSCVHDAQLPGVIPDLPSMQACAAALRGPDCAQRLAALRSLYCRPPAGTHKGRLPVGSPCHQNAQCVTGGCAFAGRLAGACGVCVEPALAGDPCANDDQCTKLDGGTTDEGLHCDIAAGVCAARREVGAACIRDGQCVTDLACVGRKCAVGAQKPMFPCVEGGSACEPWSRCTNEPGEPAKCWPISLGEEGAACTEKSATDLRWCRGGLTCRFGTCQRARKLGEPCTAGTYECGLHATCARQSEGPVCVSLDRVCSN